jgi:hypothetical protein
MLCEGLGRKRPFFHLLGGTKDNHENHQAELTVSQPNLEPRPSQMQVCTGTFHNLLTMFCIINQNKSEKSVCAQ